MFSQEQLQDIAAGLGAGLAGSENEGLAAAGRALSATTGSFMLRSRERRQEEREDERVERRLAERRQDIETQRSWRKEDIEAQRALADESRAAQNEWTAEQSRLEREWRADQAKMQREWAEGAEERAASRTRDILRGMDVYGMSGKTYRAKMRQDFANELPGVMRFSELPKIDVDELFGNPMDRKDGGR
jgi:hypothetical protein